MKADLVPALPAPAPLLTTDQLPFHYPLSTIHCSSALCLPFVGPLTCFVIVGRPNWKQLRGLCGQARKVPPVALSTVRIIRCLSRLTSLSFKLWSMPW